MTSMPDFLATFGADAPWQNTAKHVQVYKFSTQFLNSAGDATLVRVFADLRRRHIAVGWEALILTASLCGDGIEGYAAPGIIGKIAERIKRLGANLKYVAMDEPLWGGHFADGPHACHWSFSHVARNVARQVAAIKLVFPDVQIGDIEGLGLQSPSDWVGQIGRWVDAYRAATGEDLAFLHTDIVPGRIWEAQLPKLASLLHARGIKLGIIYNGQPGDLSSREWSHTAETRFVTAEGKLGIIPDQAIFQTWMPEPRHMLPETQPGTLTWLVGRYLAAQTRITLHRNRSRLYGVLSTPGGEPLAQMPVTIEALISGERDGPAVHAPSGRVPSEAAHALFILRINTECGCSGPANVAFGTLEYHDTRSGQTVRQRFGPGAMSAFVARSGQVISRTAQAFPVTAGDPFVIKIPMRTDAGSADSGYAGLVFLNAQGKEITRIRVPFRPASVPLATIKTDRDGRFTFMPDPETLRRAVGFAASFQGSARYRLTRSALH